MLSKFRELGSVDLPFCNEELSMIPFDLQTLEGIPQEFVKLVSTMLTGVVTSGTGFFTIHGRNLKSGNTLRRPAPHTDGNYEPVNMSFGGGGGWKVGEAAGGRAGG